MGRGTGTLALALLAGAVGAGIWLLVEGPGAGDPDGVGGVGPEQIPQPVPSPGLRPPSPRDGHQAVTGGAPRADGLAATAGGPEEPGREAAGPDVIRLEGRVVYPPDAPDEPELAVLARARVERGWIEERVGVDAEGRYRLGLPAAARRVLLDVEGRFLHLERTRRVDLAALPGELVLEPLVGGRVLVRLLPPPGIEPAEVGGAAVTLSSAGTAAADAEGEARFGPLSAGMRVRASYVAPGFARGASMELTGVRAGGTVEIEIGLEREVRLSGVVLDEAGEPLAGARVRARSSGRGSFGAPLGAPPTGEAGTFELGGLVAGTVTVEADHPGHAGTSLELGELGAGETRGGIELVLANGHSISGRVLWPDGGAAENVLVRARGAAPGEGSGPAGSPIARAITDAEGRFELAGLPGGAVDLSASARPGARVRERLAAGGLLGPAGRRPPQFQATLAGVAAGSAGAVLSLEARAAVRGRVVDGEGVPFERATVRARRVTDGRAGAVAARTVRDREGFFELHGLDPGTYELMASGGAGPGEPVRIEVPQVGPGPVLAAPRGARVSGRVLAAGQPVARALVSLTLARDPYYPAGDLGGQFSGDFRRSERTDEQGRFVLDPVAEGAFSIVASEPRLGGSAALSIDVRARAPIADLVLELEPPGRIEGRLAAEVAPLGDRRIAVRGHLGGQRLATTDEGGRFIVPRLRPDTYTVTLDGDGHGWTAHPRVATVVEVRSDHATHVVLPGSGRPVRIRGRVLSAGRPVVDGEVRARLRPVSEGPAATRTDSTGRFELELPRPGPARFTFLHGGADLSEERLVPEQEEVHLVFELPSGELAGRLLTRDGDPAAHARVALEPARGGPRASRRQARADAEGRFAFAHLAAGRYHVVAGGSDARPFEPPGSPGADPDALFGHVRSEPIELPAGQRRFGLSLVLPEAATVRGRVRLPDGRAPPGGSVTAHVEGGPRVPPIATSPLADGRYRLRGLGPGTYAVTARIRGERPRDSTRTVTVAEGQDLLLDLELDHDAAADAD